MYAPKFRHWMADHERLIERRAPEFLAEIAAMAAANRAWLNAALPEPTPTFNPYAGYAPYNPLSGLSGDSLLRQLLGAQQQVSPPYQQLGSIGLGGIGGALGQLL